MKRDGYLRPIEILGKILRHGHHAEIYNKSYGDILVVKPEHGLSLAMGALIRNAGYKFCYCYSESNSGRSVIVFLRRQPEKGLMLNARPSGLATT
jgi:hypothetical protein